MGDLTDIISIGKTWGFGWDEQAKLFKAVELANRVLKSRQFELDVTNFNNPVTETPFANTNESGRIVYSTIVSKSITMGFGIQSYSWWQFGKRSEIAHAGKDGPVFNRRFFPVQTFPSLTATIVHEFTHHIKYHHDWARTKRRPYSVPYAVGQIVEKIAYQLLANDQANFAVKKPEGILT